MLAIRQKGLVEYAAAWQAMRDFCEHTAAQDEEIWLLQHPPVYTLGQAARPQHKLRDNGIPTIHCDRGGQITYHGPGQLIAYCMLNLRRRQWGARKLVQTLEALVINLLASYEILAHGKAGAPGVYVNAAKIAAIGLRVRRGRTYHGISLNVNMDLSPFADINPCGYAGLSVTQIIDLNPRCTLLQVRRDLTQCLAKEFG